MKIISGGQTGADRAALDAAIQLGVPYGGWLPKGRKTEDGPLACSYALQELTSAKYRDRTEKNIVESNGTLILSFGPLTGGSALTEALCIKSKRPCLHLDLELVKPEECPTVVENWLEEHHIQVLNIAGPRASGEPRIYQAVLSILLKVRWTV